MLFCEGIVSMCHIVCSTVWLVVDMQVVGTPKGFMCVCVVPLPIYIMCDFFQSMCGCLFVCVLIISVVCFVCGLGLWARVSRPLLL